jgi:hypothetical protein
VIHYIIVEERTPYSLQKSVNNAWDEGYRPQGGVAVSQETVSGFGQTYMQAMLKEEK